MGSYNTDMTKRVILVHPPMYLSVLYGDLAAAGSELPPQGLCIIAAVLRQKGFEPVIIDATAEKLGYKETLTRIKSFLPALFVGMGVYYVAEGTVGRLAKALKKINPDLPIVVGGGHISILGEKVMERHPQFDIAVFGEGEETIVDVAKALSQSRPLGNLKGVVCRQGGKIIKNSPRPFLKNLDKIPFPAWDLLPDITRYYTPAGDSLKRWPSTGLVTSRGCPGTCFFCNRNSFGTHVRQNSPDYVIAEIKDLQKKYNIKDIYFQDDTFVANRKWVVKFCRLLIREKLDLTWACHGRVDFVDLPLLKLMKKAGCWQMAFGLESGSQQVLDAINKRTTVKQNYQALQYCRRAGLSTKGLFMIGAFGENLETINVTKQFLKKAYLTDIHITFFTVIPGTVASIVWPRFGKNPAGRVPAVTAKPSFIANGLSTRLLIKKHRELYRTFYFQPKIIWYFLTKLRYPHQAKKIITSAMALARYTLKPKPAT